MKKQEEFKVIIDALKYWSKFAPNNIAFRTVKESHDISSGISYEDLFEQVKSKSLLISKSTQEGDRIIISMEPSINYVIAFLACLYSKRIAVPMYPPVNIKYAKKLEAVVNNCNPKLILLDNNFTRVFKASKYINKLLPNVVKNKLGLNKELLSIISKIQIKIKTNYQRDKFINNNDIAYLQYTSGSTGAPKGVMITNSNVIDNICSQKSRLLNSLNKKKLIWVPPFHDLGLVYGILASIYHGMTTYLMSANHFIKNPYSWLKIVSEEKISATAGPNFAFQLCIDKISSEDVDKLDLSHLKELSNGAEPIRLETMDKFYNIFKHAGLKKTAIIFCYGLAENTLASTFYQVNSDADNFKSLRLDQHKLSQGDVKLVDAGENFTEIVSVGKVNDGIKILNSADLSLLPPNKIGEIIISSLSVAEGYWEQTDLNKEVFNCVPMNENNDKKYLRTGDLGFIHDDELYITGRKKDLIISNGINIYPQDVEWVASHADSNLRKGCSVAFSINTKDNIEEMIIISEIKLKKSEKDHEIIAGKIRTAVIEEIGLAPSIIILTYPRIIPKTTSGKLCRNESKIMYLNKNIDIVYKYQFSQAEKGELLNKLNEDSIDNHKKIIGDYVKNIIIKLLGLDGKTSKINKKSNVFDLGLSSLISTTLVLELERGLNDKCKIDKAMLFKHQTIDEISKYILSIVKPDESKEVIKPSFIKKVAGGVFQLLVLLSLPWLWFVVATLPIVSLVDFKTIIQGYNALYLPAIFSLWFLVSSMIFIIMKWLIIGKFKPGRYKLHSLYYYRWWTIQVLWTSYTIIFTPIFIFIDATKTLNIIYKMLGAKIGKNVTFSSSTLMLWDLISIGDNQVIQHEKEFNPSRLTLNHLVLEEIDIPSVKTTNKKNLKMNLFSVSTIFASLYILPGIIMLTIYLSYIISSSIDSHYVLNLSYVLTIPIVFFLYPIIACLIKWLLVGKVKSKPYNAASLFAFRYWLSKRLLELSDKFMDVFSGTLIYSMYIRACGGEIGKNVILNASSKLSGQADLLDLKDNAFISNTMVFTEKYLDDGLIEISKVSMETGSWAGLKASIYGNVTMQENSAIGAKTSLHKDLSKNTLYFLNQKCSLPELPIKKSNTKVRLKLFDILRVILFFVFISSPAFIFIKISPQVNGPLLFVLFNYFISCYFLLSVFILKWLTPFKFKEGNYCLNSIYIQLPYLLGYPITWLCREFILKLLVATPFLNIYYRMLGANIGKNTIINTPIIQEWDLISIGDNTRINCNTYLIGHILPGGLNTKYQLGSVRIGNKCVIGKGCILFPGTRITNNTCTMDDLVFGS